MAIGVALRGSSAASRITPGLMVELEHRVTPERSLDQRMDALSRANEVRALRAQLKRDLKAGRVSLGSLVLEPPSYLESAKVFDVLLALPKVGRVKATKILQSSRVSASKTFAGLSERQRAELAGRSTADQLGSVQRSSRTRVTRSVMSTMSAADFNTQIIEEFHANEGRVGGMFEGMPLLLLHHTGAKSGNSRITPLAYQNDDQRYVVFASKAGAPTNPDWYHNLKAHPNVAVEVGTDTIDVVASEVIGEERERLYRAQAERSPQFAEYGTRSDRVIPVVVLTPTSRG